MNSFELLEIASPGLVRISIWSKWCNNRIDSTIWTKCKARKAAKCAVTGKSISVGSNTFRPITNKWYRMLRICPAGIEELKLLAAYREDTP